MNEWKMVPVEPSDEMLDAGAKAWLSDDLRRSSTLYRAMISAAPPVDAQPVAYIRKDQVQQALRSGPFLCRVHPNHDDGFGLVPFYFDAPPVPAAAAVSDEWNRAIESAARVCDSRELRAHTKSAAACYRLCAQGIRAITRPAPVSAVPAGDGREGWHAAVQFEAEDSGLDEGVVESIFRGLLPAYLANKIEAGYVTLPIDRLIEQDDYGVYGSNFQRCRVCHAESGAGMLNKGIEHSKDCPLSAALSSPAPVPAAVGDEREDYLSIIKTLGGALRTLSFHAQTTGGTAGPDAGLVSAIAQAEEALSMRGMPSALSRPAPADASPAGDRELDLYDEIECDLPYLFGRASIEGHESGQRLAVQVKAKMRKARAALAQPAAPVAQERSHRAEVSDDALRQGLRTIIEYPVTHTDNMDAMNIKNIALDTLSRAALEQKT